MIDPSKITGGINSTLRGYKKIHSMKLSGIWANPAFVWLWVATTFSTFGGQITEMVLPFTAATYLHADARQMGLLVALETLPYALFSLPSGVWIEQIRKLPLIRYGHLALIVIIGSVPLIAWLGELTMGHLYVVGFLLGICMVLLGTALQVFTTHVVGKDQLVQAHGAMSATGSAARMAGPATGGMLVQLMAAPMVLLADCLLVLASLVLLMKIRLREPAPIRSTESYLTQIKEGFAFVFQDPNLRTLTWAVAIWQILFHGIVTLQVLLATRDLGLTGQQIGIGFAVGGFSAVLGSIFVPKLAEHFGVGKVMMAGFVLTACGWIILASAGQSGTAQLKFILFAGSQLIFQLGVALFFVTYIAMRQALTPPHLLSRVTSTMRFLTVAVTPIGAISAGLLGHAIGVQMAITLIAITSVLLVALVARLTPLHKLSAMPSS
jgi:MFS family permease